MTVKNSETVEMGDVEKRATSVGWAQFRDDPTEGRLQVKFSVFQPVWGAYDVLETDYRSYSVVYSCSLLFGLFKTEYAWLLTRKPLKLDSEEHKRMVRKAKGIVEREVPGFSWDMSMVGTR